MLGAINDGHTYELFIALKKKIVFMRLNPKLTLLKFGITGTVGLLWAIPLKSGERGVYVLEKVWFPP